MSWVKLLADKAVAPLPSTKQELDNLRSPQVWNTARGVKYGGRGEIWEGSLARHATHLT